MLLGLDLLIIYDNLFDGHIEDILQAAHLIQLCQHDFSLIYTVSFARKTLRQILYLLNRLESNFHGVLESIVGGLLIVSCFWLV